MPPRVTTPGASQPAIGQVGRFVLRSELGAGASGTVFLADDPVLERQVALKVPRLADNDPVRRQRFLREAKEANPQTICISPPNSFPARRWTESSWPGSLPVDSRPNGSVVSPKASTTPTPKASFIV